MLAVIFMFLEWDSETHRLLRYTKTVYLNKRRDNKLFHSTFIYVF